MKKLALVIIILILLLGNFPAASAQAPAPGTAPDAGITSLSGSHVTFDPSAGGDECYLPATTRTFCFNAASYSPDGENIWYLYQRFPADWTVNDVYVSGTPTCSGDGGFYSFEWWSIASNEVGIDHHRDVGAGELCEAFYCFAVTTGAGMATADVSWYWSGSGSYGTPHHPCSTDGYTPADHAACDQQSYGPATVPPCGMSANPDPLVNEQCAGTQTSQTLHVCNDSVVETNWSLSEMYSGSWLSEDPTAGTLAAGTCSDVSVSLDATTLAAGTDHFDFLIVRGETPDTQAWVKVEQHVAGPLSDAGFTWPANPRKNETVTFNGTAVGEGPCTYSWAFGDGGTGSGQTAAHAYASAGTYQVTLTVSNACGQVQSVQQVAVAESPTLVVTPESLLATQCTGTETTHTLEVCNTGGADLIWSLREELHYTAGAQSQATVFDSGLKPDTGRTSLGVVRPPSAEGGAPDGADTPAEGPRPDAVALISGGPDYFGYTFKDIWSTGGPTYEWIDAYAYGTRLTMPYNYDNDHAWPVDLPWPFNFYGTDYAQVAVSTDGTLYFEDGSLGGNNEALPASGEYPVETFIAPFWDNLYEKDEWGGGIYYRDVGDRVVFEWAYVGAEGSTGSDFGNFELVLFANGSILFQYRDVDFDGTWTDMGWGAAIGIQSDSSHALEYSHSEPTVINHMAICFAYPGNLPDCSEDNMMWLDPDSSDGTLAPGACTDVTVTYDATGLAASTQSGTLLIESNDPLLPELAVPVQMTVHESPNNVNWNTDPAILLPDAASTFTAWAWGSAPLVYEWNFGDGTTGSGSTIQHTYASGGIYPVSLTASNNCGQVTVDKTVTVRSCEWSTLLAETFEGGFGAWTLSGLWHDEPDSATCGAQRVPYPSATHAAYYGQAGTCTYDTGATNSGSLALASDLDLTTAGGPIVGARIDFWSRQDTEPDNVRLWGTGDVLYLEGSADGGATWTVLKELVGSSPWYNPSADLSTYAGGPLRLRFRFDTLDDYNNARFGWMVDNVTVRMCVGDSTPPDTTILWTPGDPSYDTSPTFRFGSDEPATFECALDGGEYAACNSRHEFSGLLPGSHTLEVRAVDVNGNADASPASFIWTIVELPDPGAIGVGSPYSCVLKADGSVDCWGYNEYGQSEDKVGPYTSLSVGDHHNCALTVSGDVDCWGNNYYGQAGYHSGPYTQVAAGSDHTCALRQDGGIDCWGENTYGVAPDHLDGPYTQVSAYTWQTCALRPDGSVDCWGNPMIGYDWGQADDRSGPYTQISCGYSYNCGLTAGGAVECWGAAVAEPPAHLDGPYTQVSCGYDYACAVLASGAVDCWGYGSDGQAADQPGPFVEVAAGAKHTCALVESGAVDCWGWNSDGCASDQAWVDTLIDSQPSNPSASTDATFTFHSVPAEAPLDCSLDGGAWQACDGGTKTYTGLSQGSHTFRARAVNEPAADPSPATWTWSIDSRTPQTITFDYIPTKTYGDAPFTVSASASSGLPVSLSAAGFCSIVSDGADWTVTLLHAGACQLTARQDGNEAYFTATPVVRTFSIAPRAASVTPATAGKQYGDADPVLLGDLEGFLEADGVTATYVRSEGEDAGSTYIIHAELSPSSALANYYITYHTATFTIYPRVVTVTADAQVKSAGQPDPVLTYQITGGSLLGDDAFSGALTRVAGEEPGTYPILQGTLALSANYNLRYLGADLTILTGQSTTTLSAAPVSAVLEELVTFTAVVAGDGATGTVTFYEGATVLAEDVALVDGEAEFSTHTLALGDHVVKAVYSGDAEWEGSESEPVTVTIGKMMATVTLGNLTQTYDGQSKAVTVTTDPPGLAVDVLYDGLVDAPVAAGEYAVVATVDDETYQGSAEGTLTIEPKPASVSAVAARKLYGDSDPALETTHDGFLAGDLGDGKITFSASRAAGESVAGSPYPITPAASDNGSGLLDNYDVTCNRAEFRIVQRPVTVTAEDKSKTYGEDNPELTAVVVGAVAGGDPVNYTLATAANTASGVGDYPIEVTPGTNPNYDVTPHDGTLTIGPQEATVTANGKARTYGDPNPALDATVSSTLEGDTLDYILSTAAGPCSDAGEHAIVVTLGSNPNYNVTKYDGILTIHQKVASVTADIKSKTFGDANPALTATVVGQAASCDAIRYSLSTTAGECAGVGDYAIVVTLESNPNYNVTAANGNLHINARNATVTADGKSKAFGDANPALTATVEEEVCSDAVRYMLSTSAGRCSGVGDYDIVVTPGENQNYEVTPVQGNLHINARDATVTAEDKSKTFGDANPALTATVAGEACSVAVQYSLSTAASQCSGAGDYSIVVMPGTSPNYSVTPVNGTLTVNRKNASVTAAGKSKIYGAANPELTATVSGEECSVSVVYGLSTSAGQCSGAGDYAIVVDPGTNPNYNVTPANGTLTIHPKDASVTAANASKVYGDDNPAFSATAAGEVCSVAIQYTLSSTADRCSDIEEYPIEVTPGENPNYNVTTADATLTVNKRDASVSADAQSRAYGDANPGLTATVVGEATGCAAIQYSLGTSAEQCSSVGEYAVGVTLGENPNYNVTPADGTLTIQQKDASVTADNKKKTYGDDNPELTATVAGEVEGCDAVAYELSTSAEKYSPAGDYPIVVTPGDNPNYDVTPVDGTLTVEKESAAIAYTGDTQVTTAKAGAKATVTFAATLEEDQDGTPGMHLDGQRVLFEALNYGGTLVASCEATIGHVADGEGYGSCTVSLGAADPYQVEISLVDNPHYTADVETVAVLVNDPGTGMTAGGGWLIDPNTGSRASFGFIAKFLKNGRVQGNSLYIYRVTIDLSTILPDAPSGERDYNWIIKSNAMQGLNIYDCTKTTKGGCKATITGKNNIQAVDRLTGVQYSLGGNYQFQVDVTDNREPGSTPGTGPDQYAIRVWDASGTYYMLGSTYDENGTLLAPLPISGGNIQVKAK